MSYRRWKARSSTPGDRNFKSGSLGFAPSVSAVLTSAHIGDGTAGTYQPVAPGDVQAGVAVGVSPAVGTFVVPTEAQVESGVEFGNAAEFTGTYDPMAAAVFPAEANVSTVETAYGPTGAEYAGALDMSLYTLISGVVAAVDVRFGTARYTGGSTGTCYVPAAEDVQFGVNVDATAGTFVVPAESDVRLGTEYGAAAEFVGTLVVGGGGYTYGDEDPSKVLTTATGAGTYVPIADSDTVDGGVEYGAGEEGTGVNATTILNALGLATGNLDTQLSGISGYVDCLPATLNDLSSGDAQAAAAAALAEINLDHLMKTPVSDQSSLGANGGNEVVDGTVLGAILSTSGDPDGFNLATDSLQAIRDRGDAAWITATGFSTLTTDDIDARLAAWGKTGFSLANGSIVTATFGECVLPETAKTAQLAFTTPGYVDATATATVSDEQVDAIAAAIVEAGLLTQQDVADAMQLAPDGSSETGSAMDLMAGIKSKTDQLTGVRLTLISPVNAAGTGLELIRGDTYSVAAGSQIEWPVSTPDLTDAAVIFTMRRTSDDSLGVSVSGTVVDPGAETQAVRFELTSVQTRGLEVGVASHKFDAQATLSGGAIRTVARGLCTVREDQTR